MPRIDDRETTALEIVDVPGRKSGTMDSCKRGGLTNVGIEDDPQSNSGSSRIGSPGGKVDVRVADRAEARTDCRRKVGWDVLPEDEAQDLARLFFHRPAVFGRTEAQATLQIVVQIANRDAGREVLRPSSASIDDCVAIKREPRLGVCIRMCAC